MIPVNAFKDKLVEGDNVLAIHCVNTGGDAWLDAGLVDEKKAAENEKVMLADQKSVNLNATQTIYTFKCGQVDLQVTFTSPLLLKDMSVLTRPVSYISYVVKSNKGKPHNVKVYFGA